MRIAEPPVDQTPGPLSSREVDMHARHRSVRTRGLREIRMGAQVVAGVMQLIDAGGVERLDLACTVPRVSLAELAEIAEKARGQPGQLAFQEFGCGGAQPPLLAAVERGALTSQLPRPVALNRRWMSEKRRWNK